MIKGIKTIDPKNVQIIIEHLEKHKDKFTLDKSNYALNREKFWLEWEWDLLERKFIPGIKDKKLWDFGVYIKEPNIIVTTNIGQTNIR